MRPRPTPIARFVRFFATLLLPSLVFSQDRISGPIDASRKTQVKNALPGLARAEFDRGPVDPSRKLGYITIHLAPSAAQQAEIHDLRTRLGRFGEG